MNEKKYLPCETCQGEGKIPIGEHFVTLEMAIDAGDRSMAGAHHSYEYGECENCQGTGQDKINPAYVTELEAFAKEMAEAMINLASMDEFECPFCGVETEKCRTDCPVPRAEEYLKENP